MLKPGIASPLNASSRKPGKGCWPASDNLRCSSSCLGRCRQALGRAGKLELWNEFHKEATSKDYNHLLATIMDWFDVDLFEDEDEDEYNFDCEDEDED